MKCGFMTGLGLVYDKSMTGLGPVCGKFMRSELYNIITSHASEGDTMFP